MGYIHDTAMSRFISPFECAYTAGTWTPTIGTNMIENVRTAADASCTILIPILLPSNDEAMKGAYLKSIDIWYSIATAAADAVAALAVDVITLGVDGTACAGATVPVTKDTGHDTGAERLDIEDHTMTTTITTPVWVDDGEHFVGSLIVDAAATTVFSFIGARANYTLRV